MSKRFKYDEPICVRALPGTEKRIRKLLRWRKLDRSDALRRALDIGLKQLENATVAEIRDDYAEVML